MQIEIKDSDQEYKIDVMYETGIEDINKKRNEVLSYFKDAQVQGFRKGKANLEVIKIQYRKQIDDATKRALAEEAYHNTLFEKGIKPFGSPEFKSMLLMGNKFTCEFSMFKKPDFTLAPYKDLELPKQPAPFTSTELTQKFLEESRVRFGESNPFTDDDFVQMNDNVIIDYKAFTINPDGEDVEMPQLGAEGELLTIGKSQLVGFDDNLLGMKVGDNRTFTITVPETGLPSVAGKMIKFAVSLTMGSKITPMPLGDDLAKKMNKETFADLELFMSEAASARVTEAQRSAQMAQLTAKLVEDNEFEVPHWLSLSEAKYLSSSAKLEWDPLADEDKVKYLALAENNVRLALILDRIRDEEIEAQLTDQEVIEMIRQNVTKTNPEANLDEVMSNMNKNGYLNVLTARIRDEQTLDFILKNCKLVE